ncbi:hypothetical protein DW076_17360 [Clostridium sp. AF46-12NS]|nr:hypothetical protein DW076_17360 [Clostridium sp. AF46-12NS]
MKGWRGTTFFITCLCLERSERNDKNYELIEYLNDVNREHAEVLVEQNINGKTDTSYIYGAEINGGFDRISLDRFDGSTGYYLYDARGSVSGITNEEGQVYQSYRYSVTGEITFGAPQYENEYTYNGESYNPNIQSQYLRARYYCVVTATFLTEDSYLGSLTEPLTLNRYNYCVSSYLNYTDPSGNRVEVYENLKGWIRDPDAQAQKPLEDYEKKRLGIEDAIESGLLGNKVGQIFLDYGDVIMGPPVTLPSSLVGIREAIKGNFDSKEMQRTATAGFYAGFVGQGLEYVQIISKADYQLSLLIVTQKGLNAAANPLTYVEYFRNFSPQEKLEAAKRTAKGAWNGEYDSALGRKTGAATLDYLLVAIGGALMKGESAACEVAESGSKTHVPSVNTQVVRHPEIKSPNQVKTSDVTNYWDDYLGSNQTNIHPRTGLLDNNRIFSADGTKSIRFGNHEMDSMGTTKFHFHLEEWKYDPVNDVMDYFNTLVRIKE